MDTPSPPTQQPASVGSTVPLDYTLGAQTVGTGPIDKKQPWRDIVQQKPTVQPDMYFAPSFFKPTPSPAGASKIRLLAEVDNKGR